MMETRRNRRVQEGGMRPDSKIGFNAQIHHTIHYAKASAHNVSQFRIGGMLSEARSCVESNPARMRLRRIHPGGFPIHCDRSA